MGCLPGRDSNDKLLEASDFHGVATTGAEEHTRRERAPPCVSVEVKLAAKSENSRQQRTCRTRPFR